jgi:uncharacterized phage protein (TIGR02218 family)
MPFTSLERSTFSGRPVQLYHFQRSSGGSIFYWLYNGSDRDLTFNDALYEAVAITDEGIRTTGEAASAEFKVHLPATTQFCDDFRAVGAPPSDSIFLRVFRAHADDIADLDTIHPVVSTAVLVWAGTVDGITQTSDVEAQVTCSMLAASFQRGGLRYTWMKNCPHVLYAPLTCKVDANSFRIDATVTTAHGNTVTADGFASQPDGWLTGGYIEFTLASGFVERRMIRAHIGESVRLLGPAFGLAAGDPVSGFAGCKRTVSDCIDKFANYDNYGGFPHIPGRNPYDGKPVF